MRKECSTCGDYEAIIFLLSIGGDHLHRKEEIAERLIHNGLVELVNETNGGDNSWQLTESGTHFLADLFGNESLLGPAANKPSWNSVLRTLSYQSTIVKRFTRAAPNQETILSAFQETGWQNKIDDPLPQDYLVPPEFRLRETIKSLNKGIRRSPIRFQMRRERVIWRLVSNSPRTPLVQPRRHAT